MPFVVAVSGAREHATIGDNGKLNHLWFSNPGFLVIPNRYWQGGPPGYGVPVHPIRVLWDSPPTYEFSRPVGGTYPPWTDPSYWYEGLTYHFDLGAEWASFVGNVNYCRQMFGWWFIHLFAAALVFAGDAKSTVRALRLPIGYWMPAAAGILLYVLVVDLHAASIASQPSSRYLAVFVVLLGLTTASSLRLRPVQPSPKTRRYLKAALAVAILWVFGSLGASALTPPRHVRANPAWTLAALLNQQGVPAGSRVATIGSPAHHVFWARLARIRIVADVPDDGAFWAKPSEIREVVLQRLARSGARFVVSSSMPAGKMERGWSPIVGTSYAVRELDRLY
jgi:uncharacterized membrane protein